MSNEPRPAEAAAEVLRLAEQASGAHDVMDRAENPTEYETAIAAYYEHQRVYKQTAFDTAPILAAECLRLQERMEPAKALADYIATETFVVRDDPDFGPCILMSLGSKLRITELAYKVLGMDATAREENGSE